MGLEGGDPLEPRVGQLCQDVTIASFVPLAHRSGEEWSTVKVCGGRLVEGAILLADSIERLDVAHVQCFVGQRCKNKEESEWGYSYKRIMTQKYKQWTEQQIYIH